MNDSIEQAVTDKFIRVFDYQEGVFRQYYTTPFKQYEEYIGKPFKVIKVVQPLIEETLLKVGQDDIYTIEFEDGTQIDAFGHEVCVLNYELCK